MALPTTAAEMRSRPVPAGKIDPDVKIPRQILEAGKRSEEIQRQVNGQAEPSIAAEIEARQEQVTPPGTPPPETPPAPTSETPPTQQVTPPVQGELPLPTTQPPPAGEETWEQRFKSLEGRYQGELRRSREAVTQLSERLGQIEAENQRLKTTVAPPPQPNGHDATALPLTEDEIANYGSEIVDMMQRVANHAAAPLQHEIQNLRGQLGYVQQETGNAFLTRMHSALNGMVSNWQQLNKDPRFIEWSQLPDVFSRVIRNQLMQEAWNAGEPERVAAFFQAFLAEEAATNPQGARGPAAPPPSRMVISSSPEFIPPVTPGATLDLTTLAAPGRAHSAGAAPAEKPVYSAADITRFYTDVKLGKWRGREQQQAAIDHDIHQAQHEGRIIPDQRNMPPRDPFSR